MRTAWRRLTDRSEILALLRTDRLYAGYAIGDLEPGLFERCEWYGVVDWEGTTTGAQLRSLVLCYHDFKPPVCFVMGAGDGVGEIAKRAPLPAEVYLNCREEHLAAMEPAFTWGEMTPMWRMAVTPATFQPMKGRALEVVGLAQRDAAEIWGLLALGGGGTFRSGQMERGVYRGVRVGKRLVAVAGTHLVSRTFGIAAIGNVFTHPHWRGWGFGTAVTSSVTAALLEQGIDNVILNVGQANPGAIHIYENLGFSRHCPFVEGRARRRAVPDNPV